MTIRPCPFCGIRPRMRSCSVGFKVECKNPNCGVHCETIAGTREECASNWNGREEVSFSRSWIERIATDLDRKLPSGWLGDYCFLLCQQIKDALAEDKSLSVARNHVGDQA